MRNSTAIESCGKDQPFSSCIVYSISDFIVGNGKQTKDIILMFIFSMFIIPNKSNLFFLCTEDANTALDLLFGFFAVSTHVAFF